MWLQLTYFARTEVKKELNALSLLFISNNILPSRNRHIFFIFYTFYCFLLRFFLDVNSCLRGFFYFIPITVSYFFKSCFPFFVSDFSQFLILEDSRCPDKALLIFYQDSCLSPDTVQFAIIELISTCQLCYNPLSLRIVSQVPNNQFPQVIEVYFF